ncbi:DUF5420 family protein [Achromobacter aloeverae]
MTERYFIGVGADAQALRDDVLAKVTAQRAQQRAICEKHGAPRFWAQRDGRIKGLAYVSATRDFVPPRGMRVSGVFRSGDEYECLVLPDLRTKEGRALQRDLASITPFDGSAAIVNHYGAARHTFVPHPGPTGMALTFSVGGIVKDQIVLRVPVSDEEPFEPDARLREIKKSEFIALTEE